MPPYHSPSRLGVSQRLSCVTFHLCTIYPVPTIPLLLTLLDLPIAHQSWRRWSCGARG